MMPSSWVGFERLRDLPRYGERLFNGDGALCDAIRERRPLHEFHHHSENSVRHLEAVDVAIFGWFSAARTSASR